MRRPQTRPGSGVTEPGTRPFRAASPAAMPCQPGRDQRRGPRRHSSPSATSESRHRLRWSASCGQAASSRPWCTGPGPRGARHQPAPALAVGAGPGLGAPGRPVVRRGAGGPPRAAVGHGAVGAARAGRGAHEGAELHDRDRPGGRGRLVLGQHRRGQVALGPGHRGGRELDAAPAPGPAPGGRWCRAPRAGGRTRTTRPRPRCSRRRRAGSAARRRSRAPRRRTARRSRWPRACSRSARRG